VGLAALALVLLPSCSSGSSHEAASDATVRVVERDFRITLSPSRVRAGTVRLLVRNQGPDTHELLVVHSPSGLLPLRSDGLTINEAKLDSATVTVMEGRDAGDAEQLLLHLKPGRYELFCNMAGHYLGGMHAELVVT
jgi:uncharacterized cupredoxin-like copper-binding protein